MTVYIYRQNETSIRRWPIYRRWGSDDIEQIYQCLYLNFDPGIKYTFMNVDDD